jgi:hypothetical protein
MTVDCTPEATDRFVYVDFVLSNFQGEFYVEHADFRPRYTGNFA